VAAFVARGLAGLFGVFLDKHALVRGAETIRLIKAK
jgi:hypothetical protein